MKLCNTLHHLVKACSSSIFVVAVDKPSTHVRQSVCVCVCVCVCVHDN